jgi:hypothetical protein
MSVYEQPRFVEDVNDCYFYHTTDLPGIGTIEGNWDLRENLAAYLGNVDFQNKRVLDVGCASGSLSFYMEKNGAEVVSFDLDKNGNWDIVPFAKWQDRKLLANKYKMIIDRLNNSYWLTHRLLNSKAHVVYGSVYNIPDEIGPVDIAVYGSILLHLRDPFFALQNGLKLTKKTVIVEEVLRGQHIQSVKTKEPYLGLLPNANTMEPKDTWWDIRPEWVVQAIGVLGFEKTKVTFHKQKCEGKMIESYTVVGKRTH